MPFKDWPLMEQARNKESLAQEIEDLRAALKPFAEVPPGSAGDPENERLMVIGAGKGPYHFVEADLQRAKRLLFKRQD